jgi:uncharacterized protein DUF6152
MSRFRWCSVVLAFVFLAGIPSYAHHAVSIEHDTTRTLDLSGVIKETDWNNPHAFLRLDVSGKTWLVTLAAPSALNRRGVERATLVVGKNLSVVGFPNKAQDEIYAQRITVDGKTFEFFPASPKSVFQTHRDQ